MGVCSCYFLIEIKLTLVRFPTYAIGHSLAEIVKLENARI